MKFATRFDPLPSPSVKFCLPSMTDQSQKDDCDVNKILARYKETGYLVDPLHPGTRQPIFGDFSDVPDYQTCLDVIREADSAFLQLPAKVRDRFANNPQEIFDFLKDEKNRAEAIELGLIEAPKIDLDKPVEDKE